MTDRQKIKLRGAQIVHHLQHIAFVIAEPDHNPRFREQRRIEALDLVEQTQRMEIAGARPHLGIETGYRFEVVVEHVRLGSDDGFERSLLAQKIGGQNLDCRARSSCADGCDSPGELPGPAIIEVVAIDRGDYDVGEAEGGDSLGDAPRLVRVEQIGSTGRDIAKAAGTGADPSEDHDRRVLLFPAFADVRAGRFLADRIQREFPHQPARRVYSGDRRLTRSQSGLRDQAVRRRPFRVA